MSIEGAIAGLVILLLAGGWVALPLLRRETPGKNEAAMLQIQRERLLNVYERVLTNIRDLEEDYRTGKLVQDDYETERETWVQRGIQVLKALDEIGEHHTLVDSDDLEDIDRAIDRQIEDAVAAYRAKANS